MSMSDTWKKVRNTALAALRAAALHHQALRRGRGSGICPGLLDRPKGRPNTAAHAEMPSRRPGGTAVAQLSMPRSSSLPGRWQAA